VDRICVGAIVGAKGVRGEVRIKSFTENPRDVGAYGPVTLTDGRKLGLKVTGQAKDLVVGRLEGIGDRDAAEALKGAQLFVERSALPSPEAGSYYHADLIGLELKLTTGESRGRVSAVFNFGAGDMLVVARPDGETELVPFSPAAIAAVDTAGRVVLVNPLPGLFDEATEEEGETS
jgi:16S rRNA processing protein RimM